MYFREILAPLQLGLEDRLNTLVGTLSGGQRQALALLMATISRPALLLLDEHTAKLDPSTAGIVLRLTEDIVSREKITAIMVTHNMEHALRYGNRLVMMHKGRTVVDMTNEQARIITVDFGEGCTGLWDQTRAGKIIITVTGPRKQVGSTRTVTFDNYYFNGIKVEGTKVTTNEGENDNMNIVFSVSLTEGRIILPNDTVIEREFYREREWISGYDTWNLWDDECMITGYASGTTYKGFAYENTITSALHWKRVCKFFVSGIIEVTREGIEPFEIDFGDGECDAIAVLRRDNEEKEITLRHRHRIFR